MEIAIHRDQADILSPKQRERAERKSRLPISSFGSSQKRTRVVSGFPQRLRSEKDSACGARRFEVRSRKFGSSAARVLQAAAGHSPATVSAASIHHLVSGAGCCIWR